VVIPDLAGCVVVNNQAIEIEPEKIVRTFNFIPATKKEIENGSK